MIHPLSGPVDVPNRGALDHVGDRGHDRRLAIGVVADADRVVLDGTHPGGNLPALLTPLPALHDVPQQECPAHLFAAVRVLQLDDGPLVYTPPG